MSALPPKADMCGAASDVRFGPKADIGRLHSIISSGISNVSGRVLGRLHTRHLLDCHAAAEDAAPWLCLRSFKESATKRMPNTIE
jgi:hypothetical protein